MRLSLLLFCLAAPAFALTTVAETHITAPDGTLASGYIQITAAPSFTAADGSRVEVNARVPIVNGQFDVSLEPTDTASNANAMYQVAWHLANAAPRTEYWAVPTTGMTLGVAAVQSNPTIGTLGTVTWNMCGSGIRRQDMGAGHCHLGSHCYHMEHYLMRLAILTLSSVLCASAQITTINPSDQINNSRATINANFAYLSGLHLIGTGTPSATCSASVNLGSIYVRADAAAAQSSFYVCAETAASTYAWEGPYSYITGAPSTWPVFYYQTLSVAGSPFTQRPKLNLINGTNVTIVCVDNSGASRTDCTLNATAGSGGYAMIDSNGTPITSRSAVNFSSEFTAVDNSGASRSEISINTIAASKIGTGYPYGSLAGAPLTLTSGSGAPTANCTGMSSSYLAVYTDVANQDVWFCPSTNSWKKLLSTANSGTYTVTGSVGAAPTAPGAGNVTCYFDSTSLTQVCLDASGDAFTAVKGLGSAVANNFLTYIDTLGIQHYAPQSTIGGVAVSGTPSVGQVPTATGSTTATWQSPSGGGTIYNTTVYPLWMGDLDDGAGAGTRAYGAAALYATNFPFAIPAMGFSHIVFDATTACGSACAYTMVVWNAAMSTILCQVATATESSPATGYKTLTMSSGSLVSGGVCVKWPGGAGILQLYYRPFLSLKMAVVYRTCRELSCCCRGSECKLPRVCFPRIIWNHWRVWCEYYSPVQHGVRHLDGGPERQCSRNLLDSLTCNHFLALDSLSPPVFAAGFALASSDH